MNRPVETPRAKGGGGDADCRRGTEALARGDLPAAERAFRQAVSHGSRDPHAYNNLGVLLARRADYDGAIALFEGALSRAPQMQDARENLAEARALRGVRHLAANRLAPAAEDLRASHGLDPKAKTITDLGAVLVAMGRQEEAVQCYLEATKLDPDYALAYTNLGAELQKMGRTKSAAEVLMRSIALDPKDPRAWVNLAGAEERNGNLSRAEAAAREAIRLDPSSAPAHHNLSVALLPQGDLQGAVASLRQAMAINPQRLNSLTSLLFTLNNEPTLSPAALLEEHRHFDRLSRAGEAPRPRGVPARAPGRRLRVGYLSPDLRIHSCAYFFEPLLRAHDRGRVEITCYSDSLIEDVVTERLRGQAEHWRKVGALPDQALAEAIRADEIDVLVDLAGHTSGNRMHLLARRVAPVQVNYLGYPASTGLAAMDHRITDAIADPEGMTEAFHTERLERIPGGFLCYGPAFPGPDGPAVGPPPSLASGAVTFGSFNNLIKVNDAVLDAWATLLHLVPKGRLLLKARAFTEEPARLRIWRKLEARGIARDRVDLVPPIGNIAEHLAAYGRMDIALDTFPYNGTTTTCEALWMGVPVVSFAGRVHAARVGVDLLSRVGLEELAPATLEASLKTAVQLANDPDRLVALRTTMRERLLSSPLMDGGRLARALEETYERVRD